MEKKKRQKRRGGGGRKGAQFERDVCVRLSRWWSRGILEKPRSDIFWRTHSSGARATMRHKAGKQTRGQYGDIGATDPIGFPLINAVTFSLKRGYSGQGIGDLLDRPPDAETKHPWEKWIEEARGNAADAGSRSWMIISKRNRQAAIVIVPRLLAAAIFEFTYVGKMYIGGTDIYIQRFDWFLKTNPNSFIEL